MIREERSNEHGTERPIYVLVVDAKWWWREALLRVLERCPEPFEPVAAAPAVARQVLSRRRPDVVILDIDEVEGSRLLHEIRENDDIPCLALSSAATPAKISLALSAAASFVVREELDPERLCELVRIMNAGDALLVQANRRMLGDLARLDRETPARKYGLTTRETEVLVLLADGLSNAEIGNTLHLSSGHVKKLVSRAMRRLGVRNRTEAALVARREGIGPEDPPSTEDDAKTATSG